MATRQRRSLPPNAQPTSCVQARVDQYWVRVERHGISAHPDLGCLHLRRGDKVTLVPDEAAVQKVSAVTADLCNLLKAIRLRCR